MAHIPIPNETDYAFTVAMTQKIMRDAQEHGGKEVRAIWVQVGLERPTLARAREVRYAFSPQEFGLVPTTAPWLLSSDQTADVSSLEEETEAESLSGAVCYRRKWWRGGRRGMEEARRLSGHGLCNGEERHCTSARCDARYRVRPGAALSSNGLGPDRGIWQRYANTPSRMFRRILHPYIHI
jgi:hypothetical protein